MRLAAFAWSLIALCQLTAQAQFDPDPPELSLRQMNALIRRSEALLRQGQALQALRVSEPVDSSLMSDAAISDSAYDEISVRTRSLRWTSIVRLGGAYTLAVERARDKREVLLAAEARLRELLKHDKPLYTARHAEALVALGDRMPEAYAALHALQEAGTLEEPESYAALAIAARTTDHGRPNQRPRSLHSPRQAPRQATLLEALVSSFARMPLRAAAGSLRRPNKSCSDYPILPEPFLAAFSVHVLRDTPHWKR